jgi:hypothetical protein
LGIADVGVIVIGQDNSHSFVAKFRAVEEQEVLRELVLCSLICSARIHITAIICWISAEVALRVVHAWIGDVDVVQRADFLVLDLQFCTDVAAKVAKEHIEGCLYHGPYGALIATHHGLPSPQECIQLLPVPISH